MYFLQAQLATPKRISTKIIISRAILPPLLFQNQYAKIKLLIRVEMSKSARSYIKIL